jgi:hypothetical protein
VSTKCHIITNINCAEKEKIRKSEKKNLRHSAKLKNCCCCASKKQPASQMLWGIKLISIFDEVLILKFTETTYFKSSFDSEFISILHCIIIPYDSIDITKTLIIAPLRLILIRRRCAYKCAY